jgi:hypothetical protein
MDAKIQKQLSMSLMNGVRGGFKHITERTYVGYICGVCFGMQMKPKESAGVIYKFRGEFFGNNRHGKAFVAPVCYLPSEAQTALVGAMELGVPHEFGMRFYVAPDKRSPTGYKWECEHVLPIRPADVLGDLINRMRGSGVAGVNLVKKTPKHKPK